MADRNTDTNDIPAIEARAGSTPGVVRYMLGGGLVLIIVIFAILFAV